MAGVLLCLRFEECGVSRAELSAMGARLPRIEEKGEKGWERWKDVLKGFLWICGDDDVGHGHGGLGD